MGSNGLAGTSSEKTGREFAFADAHGSKLCKLAGTEVSHRA